MKNALKIVLYLFYLQSSIQIQLSSSSCDSTTSYYNEYTFECTLCESGVFDKIAKKCKTCESGNSSQSGTCSSCESGKAPSSDGEICITCANSDNCSNCSPNEYGICTSEDGIVYDRNILGYQLQSYELFPIKNYNLKNNTIPNIGKCIDGTLTFVDSEVKCECGNNLNEINGRCYTNEEKDKIQATDYIYTYKYIESINEIDTYSQSSGSSNLFNEQSAAAIIDCNKIGGEKCQLLANLCTLQMYDEDTPECKAFIEELNNKEDDDDDGQ